MGHNSSKHNPGHVCWLQNKRHDQCGKTKRIYIELGRLHQGSALSPLLFVIIIDVITEENEEGYVTEKAGVVWTRQQKRGNLTHTSNCRNEDG